MKERKISAIVIVCLLLFVSVSPVAAAGDVIKYPADFDSDIIKSEIVDFIVASSFSEGLGGKAKAGDVDFSKVVKIYNDTNIFALSTNNYDEIAQLLERSGHYYFEVPALISGHYFIATVERAIPLTKEQQKLLPKAEAEEYNSKAGRWIVSSVSQFESQGEYDVRMERMNVNQSKLPLLIGGLPYFNDVVALFPDGQGDIGKIVPTFPEAIEADKLGVSRDDTELNYIAMKKVVRSLPDPKDSTSEDFTGAAGTAVNSVRAQTSPAEQSGIGIHYYVIGILVIGAIVLLTIIRTKKKKQQV